MSLPQPASRAIAGIGDELIRHEKAVGSEDRFFLGIELRYRRVVIVLIVAA